WPTTSIAKPSRGVFFSATTMRYAGFFFAPTRRKRIRSTSYLLPEQSDRSLKCQYTRLAGRDRGGMTEGVREGSAGDAGAEDARVARCVGDGPKGGGRRGVTGRQVVRPHR